MEQVEQVKQARATRVKRTTDVRIIVDPPGYLGRFMRHDYGTQKYWDELKKEYQGWVGEFHDFLRDHRSQDANILTVDPTIEDVCSECGAAWEVDTDEDGPYCASCGVLTQPEADE